LVLQESFFAGLLFGHPGAHPEAEILHFVKEFGFITMLLLRFIFKVSVKSEAEKYHSEVAGVSGKLVAVNLKVINPALAGKDITFMKDSLRGEFVLSHMWRNGEFFMPGDKEIIRENDVLYGVSNESCFANLELKAGPLKNTGELEVTGKLGMRHVYQQNHGGKNHQANRAFASFPGKYYTDFPRGDGDYVR